MHLTTAAVDRYGPLTGCRPACDAGVSIVAGPNESGKTLYLEALLQLLDPDVTAHMDPGPRVDAAPTGRVVLETEADRHDLSDGTTMSDVSPVEPAHLYNLFVVRDSDLALPDGPGYYTSLVEHLGNVHTTEIEAMRSELVDVGRLTPTTLNLRNRADDTRDVAEEATDLADDVADAVETATERDVDATVRERLATRRELASVEEQLATQRTAKELGDLAEATDQLQTFVDASATVDDHAAFDRETLDRLRELDNDRSHAREDVESLEGDRDEQAGEVERLRDRLADARERHAEIRQRESDVERVAAALESYRADVEDAPDDPGRDDARLSLRRYVTVGGLAGGGVAVGAGALADAVTALAVGVALLCLAVGAGLSHQRLAARVARRDGQTADLLAAARDAGFEVDSPEAVAPAVRSYRDELEGAAARVNELETSVEHATERLDDLADEIETASEARDQLDAAIATRLSEADVESIAAYESALERREEAERRRDEAATVLETTVGNPPDESADEAVAYWEAELDAWRAELADPDGEMPAVDADQYDPATLDRLERRRAALQDDRNDQAAALAEFRETVDEFDRRANDLSPPPFVEENPTLRARTVDGLRALESDLRDLVSEIERNAAISRQAVEILDELKADEERKVASLFDPDGPASETFAHLTDGRYEAVDYDPDAERLTVTRADGRALAPRQLSRATRDQLYVAARLSLARQLLGGEPGFFLLDDPFLAADRARLSNGFETLSRLAADGWQIVYLTAKPEVHEEMAAEFDCPVTEFGPLPE